MCRGFRSTTPPLPPLHTHTHTHTALTAPHLELQEAHVFPDLLEEVKELLKVHTVERVVDLKERVHGVHRVRVQIRHLPAPCQFCEVRRTPPCGAPCGAPAQQPAAAACAAAVVIAFPLAVFILAIPFRVPSGVPVAVAFRFAFPSAFSIAVAGIAAAAAAAAFPDGLPLLVLAIPVRVHILAVVAVVAVVDVVLRRAAAASRRTKC